VSARAATATPTEDSSTARPVYVYGVVRASGLPSRGLTGVDGAEVGGVEHEGIAAITSPISVKHVRARRRDLLAHSEVLTKALEHGTVLPLQFGIVFETEKALRAGFLEPRKPELEKLLRDFDGRVELRVTAFYVEEAILAEIVEQNGRVARLRAATRSAPGGVGYGARLELGELVAAELRARARNDARALLEQLRPLAMAVDLDEEPLEHQVLRGSFLVARERLEKFDEALDEIAKRQAGRMQFKYVGPLPPHSFVSLEPEGRR
jgi:hypothetical protein